MTAGIPCPFTPERGEFVIDRVLERKSMKQIGELLQVSEVHLWRWQRANPLFADAVKEARAEAAHGYMDETLEIAGNKDVDHNRARNMIQARWKLAATRNRPAYGDQVDVNLTERLELGGTLIEARKRILLPGSNLPALPAVQPTEYAVIEHDSTTDNKSVVDPFGE
jgi:hypothetical protein